MSDDTLLGVVHPDELLERIHRGPEDDVPYRDDQEALEAQALERQDHEVRDTLFTSVFDETLARNERALAEVQTRLAEQRHVIKETYAEIKVLVEEEQLLRRMVAVGRKARR